ncbi:Hsp70 family protein [Singulisphaera acidiphila]|uniref:Molecular chaperone n=1 Tax=Singulisphaera acidiphila (strain ATCC BAA-1392 / DSM 18658 / VKM B-2454 / MOB10) TaxID=886293 RepID=L0DEM2_SINAD|nr:Hsp70 family protein [Singulisphaera acidiphila]AGA27268.1 molecular chaperone [Singulisphaera acidiphila DSM 18658]
MSRYVVGIDLGTTNCALAYADTREATDDTPAPIRALAIPQVVGVNDVGDRPVLPSFLYLPAAKEFPAGATELPWKSRPDQVVGLFAREHGAKVPGRLVSSAKSWLSHPGVDRRSPILPLNPAEGVEKVSPVEASTAYLMHLRDAWNQRIAGKTATDRLEHQDVFLTVPASFDAVARELTVEAARAAGFEQVTLIEEPQAAFYSWLSARGESWRKNVKVGDLLLVCDVGGGTTDFTLIAVTDQGGDLALTRLAVGEHILLGGDNMDLALAHAVGAPLPNGMDGLDATQRVALSYACRTAKETLFASPQKTSAPVTILGRGSKVIGGAIKTELSRETLNTVLLDGFLPHCAPADMPARGRRVGLTEIGLPYASDPAITRHLARFLGQQAGSLHAKGSTIRPSAILFNGGVFKATELRERVVEVLSSWAGEPVPPLETHDLDLAVALGAAYYGQVRQGRGIRIRGGVPRSYYVGIETSAPAVPGVAPPIKALCVVPMGMEEGTERDVPGPEFGLVVGEPAEFRFLGSTTRRDDPVGLILDRWQPDELQEMAPMETSLAAEEGDSGETVPVRLHSQVTEVGTLELWCNSTRDARRWKLEFNVREPAETS